MMSLCSSCGTVVRVIGDELEINQLVGEQSKFWPDGYVCPKCGGRAVGVPAGGVTPEMLMGRPGETLFELAPTDAFALHSGLGLPEERKCSIKVVDQVLSHEPIVRWKTEADPNGRVYLVWLETEEGTRLYLGAGPHGAIVFRIRPKQNLEQVQDAKPIGT